MFLRIFSYDDGRLVASSPGYSATLNMPDVIRVFRREREAGRHPALACTWDPPAAYRDEATRDPSF